MEKDYLLQKWLRNELTDEEQAAFNTLEDAPLCEEIIEESKRFRADKHIAIPSYDSLQSRLLNKKEKNAKKWVSVIYKVAAILVIGLGVFYFFNTKQLHTYTTKHAEAKTITLPDNSVVALNERSHLEYNSNTWKQKRVLKLQGEAFFDVETGTHFDVETPNGTVRVLGTEFNVLDRDSIFTVSCYEGLVQVRYKNKITKLPVGKELRIVKGVAQNTQTILAQPKWLKNMSAFDNVLLTDVVNELEKQYNVKVQFNVKNSNLLFTGAFANNNLESALKSITHPFNLSYKIQKNQTIIIWDEQQ
ncbi:FecR family protein [Tenacibaculum tangerinum]|uniref:FecR family protein n=1 Tax=Tenacibaculum tangerinum TaxID=3038772 RepID=A0ABY8L0A8_9FLAO|nr:FecR family protein [Tenacibaculum tangerinum]WGH74902.1 FecR family protein [Tenacibaculum tangerinum]